MNEIKMIRGDTARFEIEILNQNEEPYSLQEGDKLVFTVKKNVSTRCIALQKQITGETFTITHDDTKNMAYGDYVKE